MDLDEIKQVVELMKSFELTEFEIEEENLKLKLKRQSGHATAVVAPSAPVLAAVASAPALIPQASASTPVAAAPRVDDADTAIIKSPMVGTFYRAPNPDSAMFVDIGSKVTPDSVVCIIEAMKVMNDINAEVSGTICEILTENGRAVEFGQPLFRVRKN